MANVDIVYKPNVIVCKTVTSIAVRYRGISNDDDDVFDLMFLRLGDHQLRSALLSKAAEELNLTVTDTTSAVRCQWEVNWGVSNQAMQSSVPDFPWIVFDGIPYVPLDKLLLFLAGMHRCSHDDSLGWKQRLAAFRVKVEDGTLSGLIQLSLEGKLRDSRNYHPTTEIPTTKN
eukprot:scaffold5198_cov173-Amphora_coffeaeformis.AAC.13